VSFMNDLKKLSDHRRIIDVSNTPGLQVRPIQISMYLPPILQGKITFALGNGDFYGNVFEFVGHDFFSSQNAARLTEAIEIDPVIPQSSFRKC
jgi:hypothetical protein